MSLQVFDLHPQLTNHAIFLNDEYELVWIAQDEESDTKEIKFGDKFNNEYYDEQCKNSCSHFKSYITIEEEHRKLYQNICLLHPSMFIEILDQVVNNDYQREKLLHRVIQYKFEVVKYPELFYWRKGVFTSQQLLEQYPETITELINTFFNNYLHTDSFYNKFLKTLVQFKTVCKYCTGRTDTKCYQNKTFDAITLYVDHPDLRWFYNCVGDDHVVYDNSHHGYHNFNFLNVWFDGRICLSSLDHSVKSPKDLINQFWLGGANGDLWKTGDYPQLLIDKGLVESWDDAEDYEPSLVELLHIIPELPEYSKSLWGDYVVTNEDTSRDLPSDIIAVIQTYGSHANELVNADIGNFDIDDGNQENSDEVILYAVEKNNNVYKVYAPNLIINDEDERNYFYIDITQ